MIRPSEARMKSTIMRSYRQRIYEKYATCHQEGSLVFNQEKAKTWGRPYHYYLRGWLPSSKTAKIADLGCGGGNFLFFLRSLGYSNLAGVDLSPQQVTIAKQVGSIIEQGSVLSFLDAKPTTFELLTAFDLIEHLTKDEVLQFL